MCNLMTILAQINFCSSYHLFCHVVKYFFTRASLFNPCSEQNSRSCQNIAATKLAQKLYDVMERNDFQSWSSLFKFSRRCMMQPKCCGRRWNLALLVKKQLKEESDSWLQHHSYDHHCWLPLALMHHFAKPVSAKLEAGVREQFMCSVW